MQECIDIYHIEKQYLKLLPTIFIFRLNVYFLYACEYLNSLYIFSWTNDFFLILKSIKNK